ncbi:MAG TPA: gamma-glutamyltransferase, partial [Hyphomicrobiaceae bacterium]|nr:gamma-glutamyltransferase [Hyphomicrobiaceae bacterium]
GIKSMQPGSLAHAHLAIEVSRIVQVDRRQHIGDPAFAQIPISDLLSPGYLKSRAALYSPQASRVSPPIGRPAKSSYRVETGSLTDVPDQDMTSHVSIIDQFGNALAMTTTNNTSFGSQMEAQGMVLNNVLVNFTRQRSISPGYRVNGMKPGQRPRTAMAPTLVFTKGGKLRLVAGAAGGGAIPDYVTATITGVLVHGLDVQAALAQPHVSGQDITGSKCAGGPGLPSSVEKDTPLAALVGPLRGLGHACPQAVRLRSGLTAIAVGADGMLHSAADPRRDGVAMGE